MRKNWWWGAHVGREKETLSPPRIPSGIMTASRLQALVHVPSTVAQFRAGAAPEQYQSADLQNTPKGTDERKTGYRAGS